MSDGTRADRDRAAGSLLSAGELSARRDAWRRRRARRRAWTVAALVAVTVLIATGALEIGGPSPDRAAGGARIRRSPRSR